MFLIDRFDVIKHNGIPSVLKKKIPFVLPPQPAPDRITPGGGHRYYETFRRGREENHRNRNSIVCVLLAFYFIFYFFLLLTFVW